MNEAPAWLHGTTNGRATAVEIAQLWGDSLVGLAHFRDGSTATIGESAGCAFFVPAERLPADAFQLLTFRNGEPVLRIASGFTGALERRGESLPLAAWLPRRANDVAQEKVDPPSSLGSASLFDLPLAPGDRVRIELGGGLVLLVQRVARPPLVITPLLGEIDAAFVGVFASLLSLTLLTMLVARVVALLGPPSDGTGDELHRAQDVIATFLRVETEPAPKPTPVPARGPAGGVPDAGAGARLAGKNGKAGRPDAVAKNTRGSPAKSPTDREIVNRHGVLGAMHEIGADVVAIFGPGGRSQMDDNLGGIVGPESADQRGWHGHGDEGDGPGGGGTSISVDGFGPRGRIPRGGDGDGNKPGVPGPGKRPARFRMVETEEVVTVGMDPGVIDGVVKRHLAQIQYCYEQQLPGAPGLHGKVLMRFLIAADGTVGTASIDPSSSLQHEEVSRCLVKRFRALRFPTPPGGSTVGVAYPLLFKTAGH